VIFRRKSAEADPPGDDASADLETAADLPEESAGDRRGQVGPWDSTERPPLADDPNVIDLGALLVRGRPGLELRLQTDQSTDAVVAVMLVGQDGAVELRGFAAGRSRGIWSDVRRDIAGEAARHGGTATESEGEYGPELRVVVPLHASDGRPGTQVSRVVGIEGPRWLLRVTYLGRPATSPDPDDTLAAAVRDVVVVRGQDAMAPRDPLPLRLPPHAQVVPDVDS